MASTPQSRRSSQVSCTSSTKKQATSPRQEPEAAGEVPTVKPPEPRKKSNASVTSASSRTKTRRASGAPGPAASELHEDPPTVLTEVYYQYNKKRNLLIRPSPLDHTFAATLPSGAGVQEVAFKVGLSLGVCPFVSKVRPPLPVGFYLAPADWFWQELLDRLPKGHGAIVDTEIPNGYENVRHPFGVDVHVLGRTVLPICLRDASTGKKFKLELCAIVLDKMPLPLYINRSHPAIQKIVQGATGQLLPWRCAFEGPVYHVALSGGPTPQRH